MVEIKSHKAWKLNFLRQHSMSLLAFNTIEKVVQNNDSEFYLIPISFVTELGSFISMKF